jgi:hypothetical protein
MDTFFYVGMRYKQRPSAEDCVIFLAPAEHISKWGGIPSKTSKFMKGFQRAQVQARVNDIGKFFQDEVNISPTAIVVAFRPQRVRLHELGFSGLPEGTTLPLQGQPVLVEVDYEDLRNVSVEELASRAYDQLSAQRGAGEVDLDTPSLPDEFEDSEDQDQQDLASDELAIHQSHLAEFLGFLKDPQALREARVEDEEKLRQLLANLLKPGTIVDGQHRVSGAAFLEQSIPFPVVALLDADWKEQVFQFVVINQKAEPIKTEFLSAIISSSLSPGDIQDLKERLEQAGIPLDESRIMDLLEKSSASPFRNMIDFKIPGRTGRLKFTGMLNLARRFRSLKTHEKETKFRLFFNSIFEANCVGSTLLEKRTVWEEEVWFRFFSEFWRKVSFSLAEEAERPELWEPGSNLLKVVTLQELQNLFLQWLFERQEMIDGVEDFRKQVDLFLKNLRPKFFEKDWKLTSLQSDSGRGYLRKALDKARKNPRYRYDDELFNGVS